MGKRTHFAMPPAAPHARVFKLATVPKGRASKGTAYSIKKGLLVK